MKGVHNALRLSLWVHISLRTPTIYVYRIYTSRN